MSSDFVEEAEFARGIAEAVFRGLGMEITKIERKDKEAISEKAIEVSEIWFQNLAGEDGRVKKDDFESACKNMEKLFSEVTDKVKNLSIQSIIN